MKSKNDSNPKATVDNGHQKAVSGKKQHGPAEKVGKETAGNDGSRGQNRRADSTSVGSHKPGGDGPGTKKFKHDHDNDGRNK